MKTDPNKIKLLQNKILELEKEVKVLIQNKKDQSISESENNSNGLDRIMIESEEKFKSLFNGINQSIFVHTFKAVDFNNFIEVNDIACQKYGYSRDEFLKLSPKDISSPEDSKKKGSLEARKKLKEEGQAIFEATHITKLGEIFPVEISSNIFNWYGKKVILSIAIDITDRKQAETAFYESEAKYRNLIENSGDAIYLLYDRSFEIINKKFTELFGVDAKQTNDPDFDFTNLICPESRPFIEERIRLQSAGKSLDPKYEFIAFNADGQKILVEASVSYIKYKKGVAVQGIIRDITEKRRLEQQLQQAQKMEAVGLLAGGVAHDFNNSLTVINGYSELALQQIDQEKSASLYKAIDAIYHAGKRAEKLTRQLLAYSRKQVFKAEIIDVNAIIRSLDKMISRLIGEDIVLETIFKDNIPKIKADSAQIEQIMMNLIVNAKDAVYKLSNSEVKKKIVIETGTIDLDEEYKSKHPGSNTGKHVFFSVADNGTGMDDHTKQRIFEPFFTTKDKFKGTGLGLSMVYGIVKQNKGSIYVYSEPEKGTVFKINWPVSYESNTASKEESVKLENFSGKESILLVEDEESVREFENDALKTLGYKVYAAENGRVALDIMKKHGNKIDLIVTDLIMPELNGIEFVEQAKILFPKIKVIYVSGYTDNHIVHNGLLKSGVNFINKPYAVKLFVKTIRQVLDTK